MSTSQQTLGPVDVTGVLDDQALAIGGRIRSFRRARKLTLVQLAALTDLSHPFLSQLERGHARPSMVSLERIARALGTSQVELLAAATDDQAPQRFDAVTVVRAAEGVTGPYGGGTARLLVHSNRSFHPFDFVATNTDSGDYYRHAEDEFLFVISGTAMIDLRDEGIHTLNAGDSVYYTGGTLHRWSSPDGSEYRLLIVKQSLSQDQVPDDDHAFRGGSRVSITELS